MSGDESLRLAASIASELLVVPSGNARIVAERAGAGQPVVFLHAAIADRRMWRHQVAALSAQFQVVAYDRRGFGETKPVREAHSPTADLFAVLDTLIGPTKQVVLVGCSNGGSIAIDAVLEAPGRFAALILISPSVSGAPSPKPHPAVQRLLDAIDVATKTGETREVSRLKAALFLDGALAEEGRVADPARSLFMEMHAIAMASQAIGSVLPSPPAWDRMDRIGLPVRILCGDLDIPHVQERGRLLAASIPNAEFETLPGAAHLPSLEQPEQMTERLARLLGQLFTE